MNTEVGWILGKKDGWRGGEGKIDECRGGVDTGY